MIKEFPVFSKLDLSHKSEIQRFTNKFDPYSDFNFASLYSWNIDHTAEVSKLHDNLIIKLPDYLDGKNVYSLIGEQKIDETIRQLLSIIKELKLVPEKVISSLVSPGEFKIEEDRDNFDYIYDLELLKHMPNGEYKKLRNKVNSFKREHEEKKVVVESYYAIDSNKIENIKKVAQSWAKRHHESSHDSSAELDAIVRLLERFNELKLIITELTIDDEVKAFSINEILNKKYAICHFEKALLEHHPYIYDYLITEVAGHLLDLGCKYVNWEQDLGIEGLRKSKMSHNPVKFLKKYTITVS